MGTYTKARLLPYLVMLLVAHTSWCGGEEERPVATETGSGAYKEAPMLTALVASGDLPPVEDRLPTEPLEVEPVREVGEYGGTLFVLSTGDSTPSDLDERSRRPSLLDISSDGVIKPNVARGYMLAPDNPSLTLLLRDDMKWSDGNPFTAYNFLFEFENMLKDSDNYSLLNSAKKVAVIDDYTVRYELRDPDPSFLFRFVWASSFLRLYSPKAYLAKWHLDYNPEATDLAKEEGYGTWQEAFKFHSFFDQANDEDRPRIDAWVLVDYKSPLKKYERNPYFHQIDTQSNQLPYVDYIVSERITRDVFDARIIAGAADLAFSSTSIEQYALFKAHEESGNYTVTLLPRREGNAVAYGFNLNHPNPGRRQIYNDIRFRQAMSLGINRDEVNRTAFFGLATPRGPSVAPDTRYYRPEWAEKNPFAQYNPDTANQLLDQLGLHRDREGFRTDSSGSRIRLTVAFLKESTESVTLTHELVKQYWEDLGFVVQLRPVPAPAWFSERLTTQDIDAFGYPVRGSEMAIYLTRDIAGLDVQAPAWVEWYRARTLVNDGLRQIDDFEGGTLPGKKPPEKIIELLDTSEKRIESAYDSQEYLESSIRFYQTMADHLFVIGTVGLSPIILISRPNIGNLPTPRAYVSVTTLNRLAVQYYFSD